jgi:hypothetical protein
MQMIEAKRRERLVEWLDQIFRDVQQLIINDHVFWELQRIVRANDEFRKASGLFTRWMADGYAQSATIGVRRQAKGQDQSISLKGFLSEVEKYPALISRSNYMSLYDGKEPFVKEMGERDFDKIAGKDSGEIPVSLVQSQLGSLAEALSGIEQYADRRVAHFDKRGTAQPLPTFSELSDAIKAIEKIVILYWRLLKGGSMTTMLPVIIFDWKDIFRFAWEPLSPE